jgi:small subunit ribosomal protein S16
MGLMLTLRLQRTGRKNEPHFRLVVTDKRNGVQSGKFNAIVGSYNPKAGKVELKKEEITSWISKGVQLSDTVHNFLVEHKVIEGKKISSLPKKTSVKRKQK